MAEYAEQYGHNNKNHRWNNNGYHDPSDTYLLSKKIFDIICPGYT
jgi:hypothetical protein